MLSSKMIGNKISEARKAKNLSQAELGDKIAISPQAVGKWERGESLPDILTLKRLADIFDVDLNYFISEEYSESKTVIDIQEETSLKNSSSWDMSNSSWADSDFSGLKNLKERFSSSNLKNCKFIGSDFQGIEMKSNYVSNCDFSSSNFSKATLKSSYQSNNLFNQANFQKGIMQGCHFQDCDFTAADFTDLHIQGSSLSKVILNGVQWKNTKCLKSGFDKLTITGNISDCSFESCEFRKVTFENAQLSNVFFKNNSRLKTVSFVNCTVDKITFAFLQNAGAKLEGVTIEE